MKALTILQPFASLILSGEKWVENRTWGTSYRGPLAIHVGKGRQYLDFAARRAAGLAPYPTGYIIAIARLAACLHTSGMNRLRRQCKIPGTSLTIGDVLDHKHTEGPWCWILVDVSGIELRVCRGQRGLWDWHGCRVCGCSDNDACMDASGDPCHWVDKDLCSACAEGGPLYLDRAVSRNPGPES